MRTRIERHGTRVFAAGIGLVRLAVLVDVPGASSGGASVASPSRAIGSGIRRNYSRALGCAWRGPEPAQLHAPSSRARVTR